MNNLRHSAYPGQQAPDRFEDLGFTPHLPQVLQGLSEAIGTHLGESVIPPTREGFIVSGGTETMALRLTRSRTEEWAVMRIDRRQQEDGPLATGLSLEAVRDFAASIEQGELGGGRTAQVRVMPEAGAEGEEASPDPAKIKLVDVHSLKDLDAIGFQPGQMLSVIFVSPYSNKEFTLWLTSEQSPDSAPQPDTDETFSLIAMRCASYPDRLERLMMTAATKLISGTEPEVPAI